MHSPVLFAFPKKLLFQGCRAGISGSPATSNSMKPKQPSLATCPNCVTWSATSASSFFLSRRIFICRCQSAAVSLAIQCEAKVTVCRADL